MADEIPTADWPTLFKELPIAVRQLFSHDAHGSTEAARLLTGALGILQSVDEVYAYEEVVQCLGYLARAAVDRDSDAMPVDTTRFFHRVAEAYTILETDRRYEWLSDAA